MLKANDLATQLEEVNSRSLSEDEQYAIDTWQKGRQLAHVINSPGWDVVLELLHGYAAKETARLLSTDPGDKDAVLAAHATAFAAERIYALFVEDVQSLVMASHATPTFVSDYLHSPVPPESL